MSPTIAAAHPARTRTSTAAPAPAPVPLTTAGPQRTARWLTPAGRVLLGVPLGLKMAGANALVVVAMAVAAWAHGLLTRGDLPILVIVMLLSFAISVLLVVLALEPVRALERTTHEILGGNLGARVRVSILADRDVRRVARVINDLLDAVTSERERIRSLAMRVIEAEDSERARVARELEDSTAQALAAILYQIRGEADRAEDRNVRNRLERLVDQAGIAIEELRAVTSSMHPRVLTDLGLVPALEWLARGTHNQHDVMVSLHAPRPSPRLPARTTAALFAVAREALARAALRPGTSRIDVGLSIDERCAQLVVTDDGCPVPSEAGADALPVLRERVGLANGTVSVERTASGGTAVLALIPTGTL